jgi:hypothetical protein
MLVQAACHWGFCKPSRHDSCTSTSCRLRIDFCCSDCYRTTALVCLLGTSGFEVRFDGRNHTSTAYRKEGAVTQNFDCCEIGHEAQQVLHVGHEPSIWQSSGRAAWWITTDPWRVIPGSPGWAQTLLPWQEPCMFEYYIKARRHGVMTVMNGSAC